MPNVMALKHTHRHKGEGVQHESYEEKVLALVTWPALEHDDRFVANKKLLIRIKANRND